MEKCSYLNIQPDVDCDGDEGVVLDDVTLNNAVKMILLAEPLLFDSIVCVNTVDQVVTLSGFVESMIEKDHLDKVAAELGKFVDVINEVEVMPRLWDVDSRTEVASHNH